MAPSFFPDFWLPAFNSPNANNKLRPCLKPWDFPVDLGCGPGGRKIPRLAGQNSAVITVLSYSILKSKRF